MRKGVSPLIATILVVAMTVALAGLVSQFITSFQQQRQSEIGTQGQTTTDCSLSSIDVDPDSVTYTASTTELILAIENTGRKDVAVKEIVYSNTTAQIREVAVATRKSDNTLITTANPLTSGSLISVHNTTIGYRPSRIIVTTNCPGVIAGVENDTDTNKFKKVFR